jgi:hypothetical protein
VKRPEFNKQRAKSKKQKAKSKKQKAKSKRQRKDLLSRLLIQDRCQS